MYPSACDKECCVHPNPYIVQYKYIFRVFASELFSTQSLSPYNVRFVARNSHVARCVQICYAWKSGDFMKVYILLGHPPSCTIIRFQLRLAQSSSPVRILWCNRMFVHLEERESQSKSLGQCVAVCCSVLQSEVQSTQDKTQKKTTTLFLSEQ